MTGRSLLATVFDMCSPPVAASTRPDWSPGFLSCSGPRSALFFQDHGDVTNRTKTQAFAVYPERFPAVRAREAGYPGALVMFPRQMRD
jgi:hypothetical protein